MLVFSEYQTGTIDLALSFYGYEECTPNYSFGPAIRDTYVLHYVNMNLPFIRLTKKNLGLTTGWE